MRFKIEVHDHEGWHDRILDTDNLLGVISGQLNSYTVLINPGDPLSAKVTISRTGDGE